MGSLRRLAKQLESNLAPGSVALETIYQRLEAAEGELKRLQELQETCREAVERLVRTSSPTGSAASTASVLLGQVEEEQSLMTNDGGQVEEVENVTIVAVTGDGKLDTSEQGDGPRITITTVKSIETTTTETTTPTKNGKAKKSTPPR